MSEISSGLVAVAWVPDDAIAKLRSGEPKIVLTGVPMLKYEGVNTSGIVVLSDAEAIIAQKDAEILEQCRINGIGAERELHLLAQVAAKDAEIERLDGECNRLAKAASKNYRDNGLPINEEFYKQAERIKELEADADEEAHIRDRMAQLLAETAVALKGPEKALHRHGWQDLPDVAAKQSAALKLARDALESCDVGDCSTSYVVMPSFDAVAIDEALAAIDALGE